MGGLYDNSFSHHLLLFSPSPSRVQGTTSRSLPLSGLVGFDSLPDQLVNKAVNKGFDFNILCIGEGEGDRESRACRSTRTTYMTSQVLFETVGRSLVCSGQGRGRRRRDMNSTYLDFENFYSEVKLPYTLTCSKTCISVCLRKWLCMELAFWNRKS